jgi:hypothetical protein
MSRRSVSLLLLALSRQLEHAGRGGGCQCPGSYDGSGDIGEEGGGGAERVGEGHG